MNIKQGLHMTHYETYTYPIEFNDKISTNFSVSISGLNGEGLFFSIVLAYYLTLLNLLL